MGPPDFMTWQVWRNFAQDELHGCLMILSQAVSPKAQDHSRGCFSSGMYLSAFSRTTGVCHIIFLLGLVTNSATQHLFSSQVTLLSETLLGHMSKVAEVHVLCCTIMSNAFITSHLIWLIAGLNIMWSVPLFQVPLDHIMTEIEGINTALVEDNKYTSSIHMNVNYFGSLLPHRHEKECIC